MRQFDFEPFAFVALLLVGVVAAPICVRAIKARSESAETPASEYSASAKMPLAAQKTILRRGFEDVNALHASLLKLGGDRGQLLAPRLMDAERAYSKSIEAYNDYARYAARDGVFQGTGLPRSITPDPRFYVEPTDTPNSESGTTSLSSTP